MMDIAAQVAEIKLGSNFSQHYALVMEKAEWLRELEKRGVISPATPQTFSVLNTSLLF